MKTIKKEFDVIVCEICGEELQDELIHVKVTTVSETYNFHQKCVDELLITTALKNQDI
jgi:hypothetical protein